MVVCRYFLHGKCRYGSLCRYEHVLPISNSNDSDVYRHKADREKMYDDIIKEIIAGERGQQWPLSSYSFAQNIPNFPGLTDTSFEELRLKYYDAKSNGQIDKYMSEAKELFSTAENSRNFIKRPSRELWLLLDDLFSKKGQLSNNNTKSPIYVDSENSASIFGGSSSNNKSDNIFSKTGDSTFGSNKSVFSPTSENLFGAPSNKQVTSIFGNATKPPQSNLFSSNASQNSNSIFGGSPVGNSTSIFGQSSNNQSNGKSLFSAVDTSSSNSNIFGGSVPAQNSGSIFGSTQVTSSSNIFATSKSSSTGSANIFSSPPSGSTIFEPTNTSNIFSKSDQTSHEINNLNIFNAGNPQSNSTNIFSQPSTPSSNIFNNSAKNISGIFGNVTSAVSVNSNQMTATGNVGSLPIFPSVAPPAPSNIFSVPHSSSNVIEGQKSVNINASNFNYSDMESLSDAEKQAFEDPVFGHGSIPLKPPPLVLC